MPVLYYLEKQNSLQKELDITTRLFKTEAQRIVEQLVEDGSELWAKFKPKLVDTLNKIAKEYKFSFSDLSLDYEYDEDKNKLGFWVETGSSWFFIYNESCTLLTEFLDGDGYFDCIENISKRRKELDTAIAGDAILTLEFTLQNKRGYLDGFSLLIPEKAWNLYDAGKYTQAKEIYEAYLSECITKAAFEFEKFLTETKKIKKPSKKQAKKLEELEILAKELGYELKPHA